MAALVPELQPHGGLLRAQITTDSETSALEARVLQDTPEPPMDKIAALPVVSSEQVSQFAGPLFIASLLRADMLGDEVTARVSLDGRELEAVSAWTTNEAGDLVIVVSATNENTSLFLSRPINGVPHAGTYDTTAKVPYGQLREMGGRRAGSAHSKIPTQRCGHRHDPADRADRFRTGNRHYRRDGWRYDLGVGIGAGGFSLPHRRIPCGPLMRPIAERKADD
ncbi:MAG: hypothetical protein U5Q16_13285 [Gammaproteobacteria bacterium]|nr:hypothetical protein [Gammaproteobacteria bacterium]